MSPSDFSDLRQDVKELVKQGAVHNELLRTHEARSLALQEQVKLQAQEIGPIKRHVEFVNAMGKVALTITSGATIFVLGHWLAAFLHLV